MAFGITTFAEAPFSAQGQQNAVVAVTGLSLSLLALRINNHWSKPNHYRL